MAELARTALTQMFGIERPILCGGLMWLSDAKYVAASARARCMGFITTRSFDDARSVRAEIRKCRDLAAGRPFGVNLTVSARESANRRVNADLDAALEEGVRHFETAGLPPGDLVRRIHDAGGVVIHKCSSTRHALSAQAMGVDAVAIVGMEEGGHPGMNELPASLLGALASERLRIPFALGGGIGTGAQILAALSLGAGAVVMGSRFLVAEEIAVHPAYKNRLLECDENSTMTVLRSLRNTWRVLRNDTAEEVARIEASGADNHEAFGELILGRYARDHCYREGDWSRGMLSLGPAIAFADRIQPTEEIVEQLMAEFTAASHRLASVLGLAVRIDCTDRPSYDSAIDKESV
ncbi:MAG: nitronate monooxygenase [Lautropia sp. SCN 70-15]|nr:MAG: nitronate monooxygenase [Lautropia sp. SCN 70-15]